MEWSGECHAVAAYGANVPKTLLVRLSYAAALMLLPVNILDHVEREFSDFLAHGFGAR